MMPQSLANAPKHSSRDAAVGRALRSAPPLLNRPCFGALRRARPTFAKECPRHLRRRAMSGSKEENSKFEARNPKQIRITEMEETLTEEAESKFETSSNVRS